MQALRRGPQRPAGRSGSVGGSLVAGRLARSWTGTL